MKRLMLAALTGVLAVSAVGCGTQSSGGKSLFDEAFDDGPSRKAPSDAVAQRGTPGKGQPDADRPPVGGKPSSDVAAHPARLHGKWAGDTEYFVTFNTAFEFQSNGRVFWKQTFPEAAFGVKLPPVEGSGTWTVTRVEGDRYTLTMVNDLSPGEKHGWVIVFNGKDEFTVTGFDDMPITVKRKS